MAFLAELKPHGVCDHVDGLGHVQTEFWTVATLPLVPSHSYLLRPDEVQIPLPLYGRSLAAAYLRAAIFIVGVATGAGGGLLLLMPGPSREHTTVNLVFLVVGLVVLGVSFLVSRFFSRPSSERRTRLQQVAASHSGGPN